MNTLQPLLAVSPLDGRYQAKVSSLSRYFSEYGLIAHRLQVEVEWLKALSRESALPQRPELSEVMVSLLDSLVADFSPADAAQVKAIEARTNHDVKALEYWIRDKLRAGGTTANTLEFVHFACTSEDINNLAYGLALNDARKSVLVPLIDQLQSRLTELAHQYASIPMLARTHGQAATPTTLGKEIANFVHRISRAKERISGVSLLGKINGAVGNYNAHVVAYPDFDWPAFAKRFVESLGLEFNPYTIQIEPHDSIAELFDAFARLNAIVLDLDRDMWGYISIGYFKQRMREGEVGSSTMPHKVNPIDFENSEGNIGLANAMLTHMREKLPVSRWQRDLTDSTVLRNLGSALGYCLLAYDSCLRGLAKLEANPAQIREELSESWEVLAEPIQTVMRRYGIENAYEQLKTMTRGQGSMSKDTLRTFIESLSIPMDAKAALLALTPETYTGLAERLARQI